METAFKLFDPQTMDASVIPNSPGNYIIVLADEKAWLPREIQPQFTKIEYEGKEYAVIYTGISKNLKRRDYDQHFTKNNAGQSTLRKSLGSLMGLRKTFRDKNNPENGKTKFIEEDEIHLSDWMKKNLLLLYKTNNADQAQKEEEEMIRQYNPPLNIQKNSNRINKEFRNLLKELRKQ